MLPDDTHFITDEASLRALHPQPMLRATGKVLRALDKYCRRIISLSPCCVVSTQGPNGADISPRGDPPGFVHVLDDLTLLLPDRVGNNRLDTMTNLLVNPRISLLFLVPGMNETLRVNGTGRITDDARLLATSAVKDRAPKVGIVIAVEEALLHCAKALVRSALWDGSRHIDRSILPSYAQMLLEHVQRLTPEENEPVADNGRAWALLDMPSGYAAVEPVDVRVGSPHIPPTRAATAPAERFATEPKFNPGCTSANRRQKVPFRPPTSAMSETNTQRGT